MTKEKQKKEKKECDCGLQLCANDIIRQLSMIKGHKRKTNQLR